MTFLCLHAMQTVWKAGYMHVCMCVEREVSMENGRLRVGNDNSFQLSEKLSQKSQRTVLFFASEGGDETMGLNYNTTGLD